MTTAAIRTLHLAVEHSEAITRRHLAELLREVSADQWRARAEEWEACRPRPTDFRGRATAADLAARDARCAAIAEACRNKATALEWGWVRVA